MTRLLAYELFLKPSRKSVRSETIYITDTLLQSGWLCYLERAAPAEVKKLNTTTKVHFLLRVISI